MILMRNRESAAMTEIREIREKLSRKMLNMTDDEILDFINEKSARVENQSGLSGRQVKICESCE